MAGSSKASPSVIAAAIVAILASLFFLLSTSVAFLGFSLDKAPNTSPELPPSARTVLLIMKAFLMCLSVFGVATGIGLILLRNWARISVLVWGGCLVFFGALGIPVLYLMPPSLPPGPAELPPGSLPLMRAILAVIYGLPFLVGVWWLILFNRKTIKAKFAGIANDSESQVRQKPRCPLPVAVLAWFYITLILNLLFLPFFPSQLPVFVFGKILPHGAGLTILMLSSVAFVVSGIGLLKLKRWSHSLAIGLQAFWLASTAVSMLSPNYSAVMENAFKEMQVSWHLPESQFPPNGFMQHFGWFMAFGLLLSGAMLGLLVYYRPRFLEAASKAASAP